MKAASRTLQYTWRNYLELSADKSLICKSDFLKIKRKQDQMVCSRKCNDIATCCSEDCINLQSELANRYIKHSSLDISEA